MSTFNDWSLVKLHKRFNLIRHQHLAILEEWLNEDAPISDFERQTLQELSNDLDLSAEYWNEQELVIHFIAPVLSLAKFRKYNVYNLFAERNISATIDKETITGNPDSIIAKGWEEPEKPFFCLHEYKRESAPYADPLPQCLAAMLVCRELNENPNTVLYGCTVVGRYWRFLILQNNDYAVSSPYIATSDNIFSIFKILKTLKNRIHTSLNI